MQGDVMSLISLKNYAETTQADGRIRMDTQTARRSHKPPNKNWEVGTQTATLSHKPLKKD
jgi:hypothetical protein